MVYNSSMRRACLTLVALLLLAAGPGSRPARLDTGAAAAWQSLLKLRNPARVLHVTAHPDDEQGGVLARLSRGDGAHVSLLTLTRGESGDNAVGPELFDALGLIRTEELLAADRVYGVDEQYFTTLVDYGYSKRIEEALDKWDHEAALGDVVRVIRVTRPWIVLSRFQGSTRDGHGNHSAAGVLAVEAFHAAADPDRFPEQVSEGLRPWQAHKVYVGNVRESEQWTVSIDVGERNPWLGDSYGNIGRLGLSLQRSQTSGRFARGLGPDPVYFRRTGLAGRPAPPRERTIFDGLPDTLQGLLGAEARPIDAAIERALAVFHFTDPATAVPALADGLAATRALVRARAGDAEAAFTLRLKARQFEDAIAAALGVEVEAWTDPPVMSAPVPGQTVDVRVLVRAPSAASDVDVRIDAAPGWSVSPGREGRFAVTPGPDARPTTKLPFSRASIQESRYTLGDRSQFGRPFPPPPLVAVARFLAGGQRVEMRQAVRRRESKAPYGDAPREVGSVPRLAVSLSPPHAVVPLSRSRAPIDMEVALRHNGPDATSGEVALTLPPGWTARPSAQAFHFTRAGERAAYRFTVMPGAFGDRPSTIGAIAHAAGRDYVEGYDEIDHRDLDVRYLYRQAAATVRAVDLATVPGLKVGYVMGIGDLVPQALRQLGADVRLLEPADLAAADLSVFDTIVTGTRAYAVRDDLRTFNGRLLDYVRGGGNLLVLYNTQEFQPALFAPLPGELPRNAEEVSEEDSPVAILAPGEQALSWPNRIGPADFEGWVEQRGSKFLSTWDAGYTPVISTHDTGQPPQSGGWLTARVGRGTWTYFAYALHRQLPSGVPGAYRIAANLLALGRRP